MFLLEEYLPTFVVVSFWCHIYELKGPNTLVSEVRTKASLLKFQIYVTAPTSCL
jgi:hypothetical protein